MVDDSKPEAPPLTEVTFKLSITEARNVAGLAGPGVPFSACVSTSVRGDVIETSIVPLAAEGGVHSFGHSHKLVFGLSPLLINELIAQPLLLRVSQCEPKTNEKTLVATGELFLDQLLSQSRIEACVQLTPALPPTAAGAEGEERPAPMLLVAAEVSQPLVEAEELDPEDGGLRILDLKLDGLRRLPPSWLAPLEVPGSEYPYSYAAHAAIPLGNGEEYLVRFGGGALVVRRPATTGAPADDSAPPPGEADGAAEGAAGGEAAESSVEWAADPSAPARCILPAASARHLLEALDAGAPVRIRFSRVLDRAELKEPETNAAKWAAVCEAQLEPLAALDARTASATCALAPEFPPTEEALAEEEAAKGKEKPKGKEPPAKGKGAKDKGGAPTLLAREPAELPHPYEKCGTLLLLTASTDRPLFPRPPAPPPPVPTVSQLLPQRVLPSLLPKTANAEFEGQVKAAVKELLAQFADAFGAAPLEDGSAEAREARRRELLYALNNSGAYFALKERLKKAVVRIVRESFGKTDEAQLPPGGQTDRFHADLYAHLLGLAHAALHAAFYPPAPEGGDAATAAGRAAVAAAMGGMKAGGKLRAPVVPSSEARLPQLRRLADEMEAERRWEACAALHEERLCLAESDGELWREYGLLLLRANERPKAEAALREALALSPRDTAALTAYAAALFCRGRLDEAESFFKEAADLSPDSAAAHAALGLLYAAQGRAKFGSRVLERAASLCAAPGSVRLELAESLLPYCALEMVEAALDEHAASLAPRPAGGEPPAEPFRARLCRARALAASHRYDEASGLFAALAAEEGARVELHTELGHAHLCAGRAEQALEAYSAALALAPETADGALLLRTAQLALSAAEASPAGPAQHALWARARDTALRACKLGPSASSWLVVGAACFALSATAEAEEALSEACVLNNRSEQVWAQLALLTLHLGRKDEAKHSIQQALRLGLADGALLQRMGGALLQAGDWAAAEDVLRRAVGAGGDAKSERMLADALAERGQTAEAIGHYEKALKRSELESELRHINARLGALGALTGRKAGAV